MDPRVTHLIDAMQEGVFSHPDGSLYYEALIDGILGLHETVDDEESRVELLNLHNAVFSTAHKGLLQQGRDTAPVDAMWREQYYEMIVREVVSDGGVDRERLRGINAREIASGRMAEGETIHIAPSGGAPAPAPEPAPQMPPAEPKRGLFARFLGR